ncbi:MAG: hypothetical protein R3C15_15425 [Thermoleophilia bacterium]
MEPDQAPAFCFSSTPLPPSRHLNGAWIPPGPWISPRMNQPDGQAGWGGIRVAQPK